MVVIIKHGVSQEKLNSFIVDIKAQGPDIHIVEGEHTTILGLVGDTSRIDINLINQMDIVDSVRRISEPFKVVNRKFHPENSIITVDGKVRVGEKFAVIAGPCSVESEEQIIEVAERVKAAGATMLRGGAFKPRTSPYAFRGLKSDGIELLLEAKKVTGLPIVSELTSLSNIDLFNDVDVIQVGARNMQNFDMLSELGKCNKPILLKRGLANTVQEWLMSAEYIAAGGNENIILCERGIRTFETATRNTLDLSCVPVLKEKTHLPVIVDPSHATGASRFVRPMSKAAVVSGADGLMIEVHNHPEKALCDGAQSVTPDQFDDIMTDVLRLCEIENR